MNKQRRNEISKATALIAQARELLEAVRDEEQEAFDNLSEGLQQGERGQQIEENANTLSEACDGLEGIESDIERCTE
jgi:type II secretory pathway pseudopilin PulG